MKPKKKQWTGWAVFDGKKPYFTFDQWGNALTEVFIKRKGFGDMFTDIRKVKIEEV